MKNAPVMQHASGNMRALLRRARLFVRDYLDGLASAWWTARDHDCERNGGHRWGDWHDDEFFHDSTHIVSVRDCARCGSTQIGPDRPYVAQNGPMTHTGSTFTIWWEQP